MRDDFFDAIAMFCLILLSLSVAALFAALAYHLFRL